ncbi:TM2 domain-containing protein [Mycoplasmoides fastidiosum]|nr:TM2 domain-containing protein [Mycoplasmoides fastidiosum]UUD37854.1 TM2 domain-containing protein [Mycoplasmoides fastidiosum]
MKKIKILLTEEEIKKDIELAQHLNSEGKIDSEMRFSGRWSEGTSNLNYYTNLLLAIFLGIFGIDRFYLRKYISGVTKVFFIIFCTPFFLWLILGTKLYESYPDVIVIFSLLFFLTAFLFYFLDIYFAIRNPRDADFKKLVR